MSGQAPRYEAGVSYPDGGLSVASGYKLNDDSDSDDSGTEEAASIAQIQDLDGLKKKTAPLLDKSWKSERDRSLLLKLLELDEPTITAKMVDFLLMEGVCDLLLSFITQLDKGPRPSPQNYDNEGLKLSYKAAILITADEPGDALFNFLNRKAGHIAKRVFEVFQDNSAGSFYHAARVLETVLRMFPVDTYKAITDDGRLEERMNSLLRHVGCVPVADVIVMLVCMSPISRQSHLYVTAAKNRWMFLSGLASMRFMLQVTAVAAHPETHCWTDGYVSAAQHASAAVQVLQELVEKFSLEDSGELLLQPFGHCAELFDLLINCSLGLPDGFDDFSDSFAAIPIGFEETIPRCVYLRCLCYLLKRSANREIAVYVANSGRAPSAVMVPNKLHSLRPLILEHVKRRMRSVHKILIALAEDDDDCSANEDKEKTHDFPSSSVAYPGHVVKKSFSDYRVLLMEFFVLMIEADSDVAPEVPLELWKAIVNLIFLYPHNNIYHSMFFRTLYAVLRQNDESVLKNILQKSRLIAEFFDHFMPYSDDGHAAGPGRGASSEIVKKYALRGVISNCANAIRLQMETLPPNSYLHVYLMSHGKWTGFLPLIRKAANIQQNTGLGFFVPDETKGPAGGSSMQHLAALFAGKEDPDIDGEIFHFSHLYVVG